MRIDPARSRIRGALPPQVSATIEVPAICGSGAVTRVELLYAAFGAERKRSAASHCACSSAIRAAAKARHPALAGTEETLHLALRASFAADDGLKNPLRIDGDYRRHFKVIWVVQSLSQKYSASPSPQISGYFCVVPTRQEGGSRVVTKRGMGCGGRGSVGAQE